MMQNKALPTLKGSEKQIKWATSLRSQLLDKTQRTLGASSFTSGEKELILDCLSRKMEASWFIDQRFASCDEGFLKSLLEEHEAQESSRDLIRDRFNSYLANAGDYVILDTETTGFKADDEVIELGIIGMDGQTRYSSLFKPKKTIPGEVIKIHGITNEAVADAPGFLEALPEIMEALKDKKVLVYNARFDVKMLNQTAKIHGAPSLLSLQDTRCVMEDYAYFHGQYSDYHKSYRPVKLQTACQLHQIGTVQDHRATGDCFMTLALIQAVSQG